MTISDKPDMWFQCKCFLDSIKNESYDFTLVVNGFGESDQFLYNDESKAKKFQDQLKHKVEILFSPIPHKFHPPVRWFVPPRSELCVFVDSDVIFCGLTNEEIEDIKQFDVSGMIAHKNPDNWNYIFNTLNIKSIPRNFVTTYDHEQCPFYVNYGILFVKATVMDKIKHPLQKNIDLVLASPLNDNPYVGQIALAITLEEIGLKYKSLPLRFNYPDTPNYDKLYPEEKENIRFFHYLMAKNIFSSYNNINLNKHYFNERNLDIICKVIETKLVKTCKYL